MRVCLVLTLVLLVCGHLLACPKYNRKDYRHWIDEDRDCQNTRNEVLIQESLDPVSFKSSKGCKVSSGRWFGAFTGQAFNNPKQLDIDHLVPLKEAHDSGAHAWSKSKKRDYANDMSHPDHLIAVSSRANRSKGAKDPSEWLPPDRSYWKQYVEVWVGIKIRWGLTADRSEISVLQDVLGLSAQMPEEAPEANCSAVGSSSSKQKQEVSIQSSGGSYQCGEKRYCKEMDSCEEALFHLNQCGRKGLDRDKDGVPCEKICK